MSYLYRPTPVLNPRPPVANLSGAVSGGVMLGCDGSVNWKAYFDAQRAAAQGSPWIVRSGTMGSFVLDGMGDASDPGFIDPTSVASFDPSSIDPSLLPLAPVTADPTLSPIFPPGMFSMPSPNAPPMVPYSPGAPPPIVSAGGSVLTPPSSVPPWQQVVNSLLNIGTSITKRATTGGPDVNPAIAPVAPPPGTVAPATAQAMIAQAQSLQAQAKALAATNPAMAASYTQQANLLLAQAGAPAVGTSWFTQSTVFPGLPNWGVLAGGLGLIAIVAAMRSGK
jgi:hypothetical protein